MCINEWEAHMHTMYMPGTQGGHKRTLGIGVKDHCDTLCGYWESNPDPLQE